MADQSKANSEAKNAAKTKTAEAKLAAQHKALKTLASKVQVAVKGPLQALTKVMNSLPFGNLGTGNSAAVMAAFDKVTKIESDAKNCKNTQELSFDMKEVKAAIGLASKVSAAAIGIMKAFLAVAIL